MTQQQAELLTEAMKTAIDDEVAKFPEGRQRSAILGAIRIVQEYGKNWIKEDELKAIADYLNVPQVYVFEVATFYTMCKQEPVGRNHIGLCTNVSCMLNGCDQIAQHIKNRLSIDYDEVSDDGQFSLEAVECLGACSTAPVCYIGEHYYENLTPEKVDEIIDDLKQQD